jgi:hypothetical protein
MRVLERGRTQRMRARPIAISLPLGFALTLTTYVTVADPSTMLEPSYLLEGRFALGVGMTYQYDGCKGTTLALASWSTRDDHYELGAFRFLNPQSDSAVLWPGPIGSLRHRGAGVCTGGCLTAPALSYFLVEARPTRTRPMILILLSHIQTYESHKEFGILELHLKTSVFEVANRMKCRFSENWLKT